MKRKRVLKMIIGFSVFVAVSDEPQADNVPIANTTAKDIAVSLFIIKKYSTDKYIKNAGRIQNPYGYKTNNIFLHSRRMP